MGDSAATCAGSAWWARIQSMHRSREMMRLGADQDWADAHRMSAAISRCRGRVSMNGNLICCSGRNIGATNVEPQRCRTHAALRQASEAVTYAQLNFFLRRRITVGEAAKGIVALTGQVVDPQFGIELAVVVAQGSVEQGITTRLAVDVSIVTGMIAAAGVNSLYIAAQTGQDFIADMGAGAVAGDPGDFFALE